MQQALCTLVFSIVKVNMKTLLKSLLLVLIATIPFHNFGQAWNDVSIYSSSGEDRIVDGVKDQNDNTYWIADFKGEITIGTETLFNADGMSAGALFKRDKNGTIQWVVQMGDGKTDEGVGVNYIYVDENASQVLVRGNLSANAEFNFDNLKGADFKVSSTSSNWIFRARYTFDGELKNVDVYSLPSEDRIWAFDNSNSNALQTQTIDGNLSLTSGPLGGTAKWTTSFKGATEITNAIIADDNRVAVLGEFDSNLEIGDSTYQPQFENNVFIAILDKDGTPIISDFLETNFAADGHIYLDGDNVYVASYFDKFVRRRGTVLSGGDITPIIHFKIGSNGKLLHRSTVLVQSNEMNFTGIDVQGKFVVMSGRANDYIRSTGEDQEDCYGNQDCGLAVFDTTSKKVKFLIGGGDDGNSEYFNSVQALSTGEVVLGGQVGTNSNDEVIFGKITKKVSGTHSMVMASIELTPTDLEEYHPINPAVSLFPNPASNTVELTSNIEITHLRILDINGRVMMINEGTQQQVIDTSYLPAGLYILEAHSTSKVFNTQFVKN